VGDASGDCGADVSVALGDVADGGETPNASSPREEHATKAPAATMHASANTPEIIASRDHLRMESPSNLHRDSVDDNSQKRDKPRREPEKFCRLTKNSVDNVFTDGIMITARGVP
jgi:hypothetical protein